MAKKRKYEADAALGQSVADLVQPGAAASPGERVTDEVVLLVDRLDAQRQWCASGTVIAPNVAGWPEHRVQLHLRHGHAQYREVR